MRIVVLTSNSTRHMFLANCLAENTNELVVSECSPHDTVRPQTPLIKENFRLRFETEQECFPDNDAFHAPTVPIIYRELCQGYVCDIIKNFQPQYIMAFGSSIISGSILNLVPKNRFINLHLGISPYYRGSGTNFWPFVNGELEYVGSTIMYLDSGVDTGNIIAHVRPDIEAHDNVHSIGCKVIRDSASCLIKILGKSISGTKQWKVDGSRYYRSRDFNEKVLAQYHENMKRGLIADYLRNPKRIRLVTLGENDDD